MYNASDVIGTDSQHPGLVPVIGSAPGTNGNTYASTPVEPAYVEGPSSDDYIKGVPPLETLPAQWWNWLNGEYTKRFNNMSKQNGVLDNLFKELNNVLSDHGITPSSTYANQLVTALNKPRRTIVSSYDQLSSVKNGEILWIAAGFSEPVILPNGTNYCDIIVVSSNSGTHTVTGAIRDGDITLAYGESVILMWHGSTWIIISASITYTGKKLFPIGSIYQNADNDTQPQQLLGFGYWRKITDRFLAAYGSNIITGDTVEGGRSSVILSTTNLPAHKHNASFNGTHLYVDKALWTVVMSAVGVNPGETGPASIVDNKLPFHNALMDNKADMIVNTTSASGGSSSTTGSIAFDYTPEGTVTTENTGDGESFSIIPPYYAVHTWRRIS